MRLLIAQTTASAPSPAAQVNRLVLEYFQFEPGVNPNTQVPVKVDQQVIYNVSLPQTGFPATLPAGVKPGVVVMHIWPRSDCGGLGYPQVVTFNYLPDTITLSGNQRQYFSFQVGAGEQIDLSFQVTKGTANLYAWVPGNAWSAQMISGSGHMLINPTVAGTYLVSVSAPPPGAEYTLSAIRNGTGPLSAQSAQASTTPVVTVIRTRPDFTDPLLVMPSEFSLFLPILTH